MILANYGYDKEFGRTTYKIIKCDCGESECVEKDFVIYCKYCGKERKKDI